MNDSWKCISGVFLAVGVAALILFSCDIENISNGAVQDLNESKQAVNLATIEMQTGLISDGSIRTQSFVDDIYSQGVEIDLYRGRISNKEAGICPNFDDYSEYTVDIFPRYGGAYFALYEKVLGTNSPYSFLFAKEFQLAVDSEPDKIGNFKLFQVDGHNAWVNVEADPNSGTPIDPTPQEYKFYVYAADYVLDRIYRLEYTLNTRLYTIELVSYGYVNYKIETPYVGPNNLKLSKEIKDINPNLFQENQSDVRYDLRSMKLSPPNSTIISSKNEIIIQGESLNEHARATVDTSIANMYPIAGQEYYTETVSSVEATGFESFTLGLKNQDNTVIETRRIRNDGVEGYVIYQRNAAPRDEFESGDTSLHRVVFLRRIKVPTSNGYAHDLVVLSIMHADDIVSDNKFTLRFPRSLDGYYFEAPNDDSKSLGTYYEEFMYGTSIFKTYSEIDRFSDENLSQVAGDIVVYRNPDVDFPQGTALPPYVPTSRMSLAQYVDAATYVYGPNVNLNNVDISQLDNLNFLFSFGNSKSFNGDISCWDTAKVKDMSFMFAWTTRFNQNLSWNTESVTTMEAMFEGAESFNRTLDFVDLSNVTNMSYMFAYTKSFNQELDWDTSSVTNMSNMFRIAYDFNQELDWDTSSVTDMSNMFRSASDFNQKLDWDTSSVTDMSYMFSYTSNFNQELDWDVSSVTNMSSMFRYASVFNQELDWDTSSVTDMSYMFSYTSNFNQELDWDTSSVTDMSNMFSYTSNFNQELDWDVSSVTDMSYMFFRADSFNRELDWNTKNVKNMLGMFKHAKAFNGILNNWNTHEVTNMSEMFEGAISFNRNISNFNVQNVTDMSNMFFGALRFNQNLPWVADKLTDVSGMFEGASGFNGSLRDFGGSSIRNMSRMFKNATSFNRSLYLNTSLVTDMSEMFMGADKFNQNIVGWGTGQVKDMSKMFMGAAKFNQNIAGWNTARVENMSEMFRNASSFNQNLSNWQVSNVDDFSYMFDNAQSFLYSVACWEVGSQANVENIYATPYLVKQFSPGAGSQKCGSITEIWFPPADPDAALDEVYMLNPHNTYGTEGSLKDWLSVGYRSLELDIYPGFGDPAINGGELFFPVLHLGGLPFEKQINACGDEDSSSISNFQESDKMKNRSYLRDCFYRLNSWVNAQSSIGSPIFLFLDLKSSWLKIADDLEGMTWGIKRMIELETMLENKYADSFFTPEDLYDYYIQQYTSTLSVDQQIGAMRYFISTLGWPRLSELDKKYIIIYTGSKGVFDDYTNYLKDNKKHALGFFCPGVDSADDISDTATYPDGYYACSNIEVSNNLDTLRDILAKSSEYKQFNHTWGTPTEPLSGKKFSFRYLMNALGANHIGFNLDNAYDSYNSDLYIDQVPLVGKRGGRSKEVKIVVPQGNLCLTAPTQEPGRVVKWEECSQDTLYQKFEYTSVGQLRLTEADNDYCLTIDDRVVDTQDVNMMITYCNKKYYYAWSSPRLNQNWYIKPDGTIAGQQHQDSTKVIAYGGDVSLWSGDTNPPDSYVRYGESSLFSFSQTHFILVDPNDPDWEW